MQQIIDFILEVDKLKGVTRKIRVRGVDRYENPAEHSWQIALLAASMVHYAERPVNIDRVIAMLLVHDVGEIDAGDTIAFAESGWTEIKATEAAGVRRIFGLLEEPQRSSFIDLWQEFEDGETAEARFAHAADRAMPVLLNLANNGQSWRENGITHERVVRRVADEIRNGCPALWEHIEARLNEARDQGWFGAD
jgi:putative hydrolase of HD superfamily